MIEGSDYDVYVYLKSIAPESSKATGQVLLVCKIKINFGGGMTPTF